MQVLNGDVAAFSPLHGATADRRYVCSRLELIIRFACGCEVVDRACVLLCVPTAKQRCTGHRDSVFHLVVSDGFQRLGIWFAQLANGVLMWQE